MSSAGRCIACSTSSGMVVGPGMARNSRPARTVICWFSLIGGTKGERHGSKLGMILDRGGHCERGDAMQSRKISQIALIALHNHDKPHVLFPHRVCNRPPDLIL